MFGRSLYLTQVELVLLKFDSYNLKQSESCLTLVELITQVGVAFDYVRLVRSTDHTMSSNEVSSQRLRVCE